EWDGGGSGGHLGPHGCRAVQITHDTRRIASDDSIRRHVSSHDGASANESLFANSYAAKDSSVAADGDTPPDAGGHAGPILFALQRAIITRGARKQVIYKHHAVADERLVLDGHARTDESVALHLHPFTDDHLLLDLDEGADAAVVADVAAVKIDETR